MILAFNAVKLLKNVDGLKTDLIFEIFKVDLIPDCLVLVLATEPCKELRSIGCVPQQHLILLLTIIS